MLALWATTLQINTLGSECVLGEDIADKQAFRKPPSADQIGNGGEGGGG